MRLFITVLFSLSVMLSSSTIFANDNSGKSTSTGHSLKITPEVTGPSSDRFPGDPASHKVVYMFNKSDAEYQTHILNSIQALLQLYGDDVEVAVVAIGPGIHVLAKKPMRKVDSLIYQRVKSFAKDYNVRWIACGNTMKTIGWTDTDIRPFAEYAEVGAAALMALQENGYKLLVW